MNKDLTKGSLKKHLLQLSIPTIGGMLAFTIFNLTDTFYVSKLGTDALAAMGFTFPVVMVIGAISSGMSLGAGSLLARAVGNKDDHKMHRILTDGILLSLLSVVIFTLLGLLTIEPLFKVLGASQASLPLIKEYMVVWYLGVVFIVTPPVTDSAMRAMGDMKRPLMVMLTCAGLNIILDPILIFGWFGLPALGIKGAAIATVISRAFGMVLSLSFVHFHYKLLDFNYKSIHELISSWKAILHIGMPSAAVRLFPQLLRSLLTFLASIVGGDIAVAAIATGTRIESFTTVISMAIGTALIPLVGQNFGANQLIRVEDLRKMIIKLGLMYSSIFFMIVFPLADYLIKIFTKNTEVIQLSKWYLWIMVFSAMGLNIVNWLSQALNAMGKPMVVARISMLGTLVILMPLTYIGSLLGGFVGMLLGLGMGQFIVALYAIYLSKKTLDAIRLGDRHGT